MALRAKMCDSVTNEVDDITVRIIGRTGKDSVIQSKRKVHIYDNASNVFETSSARMHLSSDTSIHRWNYNWFKYDKNGFLPILFYNNADRIICRFKVQDEKIQVAAESPMHGRRSWVCIILYRKTHSVHFGKVFIQTFTFG